MEKNQGVKPVRFSPALCKLLKAVVAPIFFILGPLKVTSECKTPDSGGFLILSNHRSDIDALLVQWAFKRHIHFMAKSELFEMKVVGTMLRFWKAFPVHRDTADLASIKVAVALLKAGEIVCIFPEGETSEDGNLLPLKAGICLVAKVAELPVICVGINESERIMPYGSLVLRPSFHTIRIRKGKFKAYSDFDSNKAFLDYVGSELLRLTAGSID